MEKLLTMIYEGGIYRFNELFDLLEDVGAHIMRREDTSVSTTVIFSIFASDLPIVTEKTRSISGELKRAPLAGTEIAVVSPSPSGRHLPHPSCDIAEFLRRNGAQTILINLARGIGQEPIMDDFERDLINECDIAVFIFGESAYCLENKKSILLEEINVPKVITGGPMKCTIPHATAYVGGFGRKYLRLKGKVDIQNLRNLVDIMDDCLTNHRMKTDWDHPHISLQALGKTIEDNIPDIKDVLSPSPITIKSDSVRVKLPFDDYADKIANVIFMGSRIQDIASISRSVLKDYILIKLKIL